MIAFLPSPVLILTQFPLPCGAVVFQAGILCLAGFEERENRIVTVVAAGVFREQQASQEFAWLVIIMFLAQAVSAMPADHFPQTCALPICLPLPGENGLLAQQIQPGRET